MIESLRQMSSLNTPARQDVAALRNLWLAVIHQAIVDASWSEREWRKIAPRSARNYERVLEFRSNRAWAMDWLNSTVERSNSFVNICAMIGLQADGLREAVRSGRARRMVLVWSPAGDIARTAGALAGVLTLEEVDDKRRNKEKQDKRRAEYIVQLRQRLSGQVHAIIADGGMDSARDALTLAEYLLSRADRDDLRQAGIRLSDFLCS